MTIHSGVSAPLALPISSLLPPSTNANSVDPLEPLPFPYASLLGPLPPTSPLHLALSYLGLADLPEYRPSVFGDANATLDDAIPRAAARSIIINCSSTWSGDMEEDDEGWLRDHGAEYGIMEQLSRVDIR